MCTCFILACCTLIKIRVVWEKNADFLIYKLENSFNLKPCVLELIRPSCALPLWLRWIRKHVPLPDNRVMAWPCSYLGSSTHSQGCPKYIPRTWRYFKLYEPSVPPLVLSKTDISRHFLQPSDSRIYTAGWLKLNISWHIHKAPHSNPSRNTICSDSGCMVSVISSRKVRS
jgi:hypothetical protein